MPGALLQGGVVATCPHGGEVTAVSTGGRVLVDGLPSVTTSDDYVITGCVYTVGVTPSPCVALRWLSGATRVTVLGQPVVVDGAIGVCLNAEQVPQGAPTIVSTQARVLAQ